MNLSFIVERDLGLKLIARQEPTGVTRESTTFYKKQFFKYPTFEDEADRVILVLDTKIDDSYSNNLRENGSDYLTYLVDTSNNAIMMDGFSWGYGGEGPRGLFNLLREINIPIEFEAVVGIPSAVPGVWSINKQGKVEQLKEFENVAFE